LVAVEVAHREIHHLGERLQFRPGNRSWLGHSMPRKIEFEDKGEEHGLGHLREDSPQNFNP
jgi:hypothetical protein